MVQRSVIEARLSQLGIKISRWFKPEINELENLLLDDERIISAVPGRYFSGFALLVATERRMLLLDKRAFFMTVEDIRYDMVSQINFSTRFFDATVDFFTLNKEHVFTTIRYKHQLREMVYYVQNRVAEIRQHQGLSAGTVVQRQNTPLEPVQDTYQTQTTHAFRNIPAHLTTGLHLPHKIHVPRRVGTAAISGATTKFNPNPYMQPFLVGGQVEEA